MKIQPNNLYRIVILKLLLLDGFSMCKMLEDDDLSDIAFVFHKHVNKNYVSYLLDYFT